MAKKAKTTFRGVVLSDYRPTQLVRAVANAPVRALAPAEQKVRVGREVSGRGGKAVTVVTGLVLGAAELEALAGELKRGCGAGGGVRDGRIEIQGEQRDKVVAELVKRGYPAKRSGG
ncbi:MAG: stress response translation initiation inhibitor YciH [Steroidobacteraceae bacterium]